MNNKITKVVRIIARLNVGGPARHVVWLTDGLDKSEFETALVTGRVPEGEKDMVYFADEHSVEPWFVDEMSRELSPKDLIALWKIWRKLVAESPNVIHTHTAKAGTLGRIAALFYRYFHMGILIGRPRNAKVFHTFHGHIFHNYYGTAKTKLFLFIEKFLARFATTKVIVITEQQRKEIHEDFGVGSEEQFEVIRLGLDLKRLTADSNKRKQFRDECGVDEETLLVGIVGRLTAIKNHHLFIDAVRKFGINSDHPKTKFVVIGDGDLRDELEHYARDTGILFIGNRNDPDVFYSGLDAVVLSSKNEGTPLSVIEAMSFGLPWISTEVGGVVDLAGALSSKFKVHGSKSDSDSRDARVHERGILVDSDDVNALCEAIRMIVENPGLRTQISESSTQWVERNYSKERLINDIENLYRK